MPWRRFANACCATAALDQAGVPYAVIGGNAVAAWVTRVDESAVRYTQDVDILLRRDELPAAKAALEKAGFVYRHAAGIDMFLEDRTRRSATPCMCSLRGKSTPGIRPAHAGRGGIRGRRFLSVLTLEALVRMKLTSFRRKYQVHIQDLLGVGLIDASWLSRFPPELAARLKEILDTPEG